MDIGQCTKALPTLLKLLGCPTKSLSLIKIAKASTAGNFYIDVLLFSDSVNVFVDKWVKSGSEAVQKLLEVVPEHED